MDVADVDSAPTQCQKLSSSAGAAVHGIFLSPGLPSGRPDTLDHTAIFSSVDRLAHPLYLARCPYYPYSGNHGDHPQTQDKKATAKCVILGWNAHCVVTMAYSASVLRRSTTDLLLGMLVEWALRVLAS
jgi:hypothetical protein